MGVISAPPPDWLLDHLRSSLRYDPESGSLTWRVPSSPRCKPDTEAGYISDKGYRVVHFRNRPRRYARAIGAHIIGFYLMTGRWPDRELDHRDRDPSNNRWSNLRLATASQQKINEGLRANNTTGVTGVAWHKASRSWQAYIRAGKRQLYLGTFGNFAEAAAARRVAEITYFDAEFRA